MGLRRRAAGDHRRVPAFGAIPPPQGGRQAAADGNQWIFSDIGLHYAQFLALHDGAPPTEAELGDYFRTTFDQGDEQIRSAFAAYAEARLSTDPVRRQVLTYQGNVLVAVHEQAGAQQWLEKISLGPDGIATTVIDLRIGDRPIDVDKDIEPFRQTNNQLLDQKILSLDPGGRTAQQLAPTVLGGVELPELRGVPELDGALPVTLDDMARDGGGVLSAVSAGRGVALVERESEDPDSLDGSGARSWPDRSERMWQIARLFEQAHAWDQLWTAGKVIGVGFDSEGNAWLDPATGLRR